MIKIPMKNITNDVRIELYSVYRLFISDFVQHEKVDK